MAHLPRVMRALYCEPWLIRPEMHRKLCDIVWAHITEDAHKAGGIGDWFGDRSGEDAVTKQDGVATVSIDGVIGRRFSKFVNSSGVVSVDVLERVLLELAEDSSVGAVVLDVDSPGGTVTGTPEAAAAVEALTAQKPVVAFTGGLMASGAYWLSVPADAIFAAPSAHIGSIGVYAAFLDESRAYENEGMHVELFKRGKYKAMGLPGLPLTDEQKVLIQERVDKIYEWFTGVVSSNRQVQPEAMEGQTYMGKAAMDVGLIDGIGTIADAVQHAKEQAEERGA